MNWHRLRQKCGYYRNWPGPLGQFCRHRAADLGQDYRQLEMLAVDLETTALQPQHGEIVSIGFVPLHNGRIQPGAGKRLLLKTRRGVGQSATIHGVHDRDLVDGLSLADALQQWLAAQAGKLFVAHHAPLDLAFLRYYCEQQFGHRVPLDVIDTMALEQRRLRLRGVAPHQTSLRLAECRQRYNLPEYKAHDPLVDAIATAELLLAQAAHMAGAAPLPARQLIRP